VGGSGRAGGDDRRHGLARRRPARAQRRVAPWLRVAALGTIALRLGAPRAALAALAATGAFALCAGPASYAVANLGRGLDGNNVLAGPASVSQGGFGGDGGPGAFARGGTPPSGSVPGDSAADGSAPDGSAPGGSASGGLASGGSASGGSTATGAGQAGGPSPGGGLGGRASVSADMLAYLVEHQGSAKYLLAATGSQTTAPIIIQTGKAVVTIGGFSGRDNSPTVAQLQKLVAAGRLEYVLASGNGALDTWVPEHGTAVGGFDGLYRVTA
jgi:hypothetical protein